MTEMRFATSNYHRTVFQALLDARHVHGGRRVIVEDVEGNLLTYNQLIRGVFVVGKKLAAATRHGECVGLMLPNMVSTLIAFLALHCYGRVPAMLNFSAGGQGVVNACVTAGIRTVYTSSRFVERARLQGTVAHLRAIRSVSSISKTCAAE